MEFDSRAHPSLTLTAGGDGPMPVKLPVPQADGYRRELEYFFECLNAGLPVQRSTGAQAARSLAVTLAEIESASAGGQPVKILQPSTN